MPKLFHIDVSKIQSIWPEFRFRDEQYQMAEFIQKGIQEEKVSLIEAGTGVGKTLAYLLPMLDYLKHTHGRVVISTETRALQEQIIDRDLPMAQKIYGTDFEAEICMGAGNYLCKRRLAESVAEGKIPPSMTDRLSDFLELESRATVGMYSDFKEMMTQDFWTNIRREKDECLSNLCPNYRDSYYFLAKNRWKDARILIVNHSLLASHYAFNEMLLPQIDCIVVDEAHSFADTFHRTFTNQSSYMDLLRLVYSLGQGYGSLLTVLESFRSQMMDAVINSRESRIRVSKKIKFESIKNLIDEILGAEDKQTSLIEESKSQGEFGFAEDEKYKKNIIEMKFKSRLKQLQGHRFILESFSQDPKKGIVHWLEFKTSKESKGAFPVFHTSPLESGGLLAQNFFESLKKVVLTSATLCTSKKNPFLYSANHLGLHLKETGASTLQLRSPFDYKNKALLYLPKDMPDPTSVSKADFQKQIKEITNLINLSRGGAFILFTSKKSLQAACIELRKNLREVNIISQLDEGGASGALFRFRKDKHSVLLGLATFWQGVDVSGDHLRLVVIVRLPFRVPDEPLLAARMESVKSQGLNPFMEIQLPQAIISLKQGFGRLIRSESDRGIVAILDPRVTTRQYGSLVLESLPEAKKVYNFAELKKEYDRLFVTNNNQ